MATWHLSCSQHRLMHDVMSVTPLWWVSLPDTMPACRIVLFLISPSKRQTSSWFVSVLITGVPSRKIRKRRIGRSHICSYRTENDQDRKLFEDDRNNNNDNNNNNNNNTNNNNNNNGNNNDDSNNNNNKNSNKNVNVISPGELKLQRFISR